MSKGRFIEVDNAEMIVGIQAARQLRSAAVEIPADSSLVLFTDGVVEHQSPDGTEFGTEGLKEWMKDWHEAPASMALHSLLRRLEDFGQQKPFIDDVTVIYLKRF